MDSNTHNCNSIYYLEMAYKKKTYKTNTVINQLRVMRGLDPLQEKEFSVRINYDDYCNQYGYVDKHDFYVIMKKYKS
jgi:hypothetical protein